MLMREYKPTDFYYAHEPNNAVNYAVPLNDNKIAVPRPQAYKDTSADTRKGLSSFFAYGKRSAESDAFKQAHMTPGGTPGVLNIQLNDTMGRACPYAMFNWDGRQMLTDAKGQIKFVERDYFQTAISLENERVKYVTQMISLVAGQPAENVIALFGIDFYDALGGGDKNKMKAVRLYEAYLFAAGVVKEISERKARLFARYADAECSPEVMCNFGDNDPEWSRAFNKLSLLIEYHPSAILFDKGSLNPLESSGTVHGDSGHSNAGPVDEAAHGNTAAYKKMKIDERFQGPLYTSASGPGGPP
jgi:hypothetical protein